MKRFTVLLLIISLSGFALEDKTVLLKKPHKPSKVGRWGDDSRIGLKNSIYRIDFEVDHNTGNLFTAALYDSSGHYYGCLYQSTDSGRTWNLTYREGADTSYIRDIELSILRDHIYAAYIDEVDSGKARIRRFNLSDGSIDSVYGVQEIFSRSTEIREIALTSDAFYYDDNIYCYSILDNDSIILYNSDTLGLNWSRMPTSIDNADRGLDCCFNNGYYYLLTSYIGSNDSLYLAGKIPFCKHIIGAIDYTGSFAPYKTSISACEDTIIALYNYWDSSFTQTKYAISYDAGTSWNLDFIGNQLETNGPGDVSAEGGEGLGVFYAEYMGSELNGLFRYRDYPQGPWNAPDTIADFEPNIYVKPVVEWISDSTYGVVYVNHPEEHLYFDRSDWTSGIFVDESGKESIKITKIKQRIFSTETQISLSLSSRSRISVSVYDVSGKFVKNLYSGIKNAGKFSLKWTGKGEEGNLLPAGVYILSIKAGRECITDKIIFTGK